MTEINSGLVYSPKLKEAMAEIKAILTKHDIAGHVLLHEPGFSEYLLAVEPSWSVLQLIDGGVRIRSKLVDFNGDKDAQHKASESTASLIRIFADLLERDSILFEKMHDILMEHWDITHTQGIHTPHRPQ